MAWYMYIDLARIKSFNFFSGRNFEMTCKAQGPCSHSCKANSNIFNCNPNQNNQCSLNCNGQSCIQTCNSGKCDLECDGPDCKQICNNFPGECSLKCNGGDCEQSCNRGNCGLECGGAKCTHICGNQLGQCTLTCKGKHCVQTCNGVGCSLQCNENYCEQTCNGAGTCRMECHRGNCNQKCNKQCNLECRRGRCTQDCSQVADSCQLQCLVVSGPTERCRQECPDDKKSYCNKKSISTTKAPTAFSEHCHSCTGEWSNSSASVSRYLATFISKRKTVNTTE